MIEFFRLNLLLQHSWKVCPFRQQVYTFLLADFGTSRTPMIKLYQNVYKWIKRTFSCWNGIARKWFSSSIPDTSFLTQPIAIFTSISEFISYLSFSTPLSLKLQPTPSLYQETLMNITAIYSSVRSAAFTKASNIFNINLYPESVYTLSTNITNAIGIQ